MILYDFLNNKPLSYDKIDFSTIEESWNFLSKNICLPYVIHIVGTNGKGSTGRFLASFLNDLNFNVLHYSSPHVMKFNERIWINGCDVEDSILESGHEYLQNTLSSILLEKLTYFEYTTLLAIYLSSDIDYLVLEAGLGGEFDATNVVKNNLTLVPSIGIDHTEFLGNTITEIAGTKLRSSNDSIIFSSGITLGDECISIANENISLDALNLNENINLYDVSDFNIELPTFSNKYKKYLLENLKLSLSALRYLKISYNLNDLNFVKLFGRFQYIEKNIVIDVGHNPLAALAIKDEYINKKCTLIYNSMTSKDYNEVLEILKDVVWELQFINCNDSNMLDDASIKIVCEKHGIKLKVFDIKNMNENINYLVFGSFRTVEEFLKQKAMIEK